MSSKHLAARLLSRKNRLTRGEKDAIFGRVLAETGRRRARRWPALGFALAAAAAAVVVIPWAIREHGADPSFAPRGDDSAAMFDLACAGQRTHTCHLGQTLVFDLQAGYRYFAAFARRDDGTVIWYFPDSATGRSLDLRDRIPDGVLDRGIALDAAHGAGDYQVYGIYSAAPLSRDDIKSRFRPGAKDLGPETSVATRELVIQ